MDGRHRDQVRPGQRVRIVLKQDQASGRQTAGVVQALLTRSAFHPHGIKVRLTDGRVGRVKAFEESGGEEGARGQGTRESAQDGAGSPDGSTEDQE